MDKVHYKLGQQKIGKLLLNMSVPAVAAMIINALYNMVDTIVVGQGISLLVNPDQGTYALGGLSIVFPIQMSFFAISGMIGIGGASIVSRALGDNNQEKAVNTAGNAFLLSFILGLAITLALALFSEKLLLAIGATENNLPYAQEYITYILPGIVNVFLSITGFNLVRSEGKSFTATIMMVSGAVLNIILDPIFVFVLELGVKGVAIATVLSRVLSLVLIILYFISDKSHLKFSFRHLIPKKPIVLEIFAIGSTSFFRQMSVSILATILNISLNYYGGDIAISIYGIINKCISFVMMILFGMVQGLQPIAGYNYTAKKPDRLKKALKISMIGATIISTTAFVIYFFFTKQVFQIFSRDDELIRNGIPALKTVITFYPLIGLHIIGSGLPQAIGKAGVALVITLSRQVFVLIPCLLILPLFFGLDGLWYSFPIADIIGFVITMSWLRYEMRTPEMLYNRHKE